MIRAVSDRTKSAEGDETDDEPQQFHQRPRGSRRHGPLQDGSRQRGRCPDSISSRIFRLNMQYNYVYNEPDNTEKLYEVNKKLNEFSKNLKNMKENENEDMDNINNENNIINNNNNNNTEIEKRIKIVNDKFAKLEKKMNDLNKDYEEEKNNIKINLKTIEECQKFIIDSMKSNEKEN